jgi:ribose 5-phosphate isomerase B
MRIAVAADELTGVAEALPEQLRERGHEPILHGAYSKAERPDWAWACEAAARDVACGHAHQAIVACWTGTGASIAANKVPGVRAALAWEPWIAEHARRWNDANVLAMSLKRLAPDVAVDCVRAFLSIDAEDPDETANIDAIRRL